MSKHTFPLILKQKEETSLRLEPTQHAECAEMSSQHTGNIMGFFIKESRFPNLFNLARLGMYLGQQARAAAVILRCVYVGNQGAIHTCIILLKLN